MMDLLTQHDTSSFFVALTSNCSTLQLKVILRQIKPKLRNIILTNPGRKFLMNLAKNITAKEKQQVMMKVFKTEIHWLANEQFGEKFLSLIIAKFSEISIAVIYEEIISKFLHISVSNFGIKTVSNLLPYLLLRSTCYFPNIKTTPRNSSKYSSKSINKLRT